MIKKMGLLICALSVGIVLYCYPLFAKYDPPPATLNPWEATDSRSLHVLEHDIKSELDIIRNTRALSSNQEERLMYLLGSLAKKDPVKAAQLSYEIEIQNPFFQEDPFKTLSLLGYLIASLAHEACKTYKYICVEEIKKNKEIKGIKEKYMSLYEELDSEQLEEDIAYDPEENEKRTHGLLNEKQENAAKKIHFLKNSASILNYAFLLENHSIKNLWNKIVLMQSSMNDKENMQRYDLMASDEDFQINPSFYGDPARYKKQFSNSLLFIKRTLIQVSAETRSFVIIKNILAECGRLSRESQKECLRKNGPALLKAALSLIKSGFSQKLGLFSLRTPVISLTNVNNKVPLDWFLLEYVALQYRDAVKRNSHFELDGYVTIAKELGKSLALELSFLKKNYSQLASFFSLPNIPDSPAELFKTLIGFDVSFTISISQEDETRFSEQAQTDLSHLFPPKPSPKESMFLRFKNRLAAFKRWLLSRR